MSVSVRHAFTSGKPDSSDSSIIQPSHWNAEHVVIGSNEGYWSQDYNFTAIMPGGNLVPGSNSINFGNRPLGVLTGDLLYISGGAGAAEVVPVTGTIGNNQAIVTCANAHSGGWTVKSASAGIMEAMFYMLSINPGGGEVRISPGVSLIYGLVIGNGAGVTDSTIQNITLRGVGKGPDDYLSPNAAGSDLVWAGSAGGTLLRISGPIRTCHFCDFRLNGNSGAAHLLDLYSVSLSSFERLTIMLPQIGGECIRMEAGAGFNAPSDSNIFSNISLRAIASRSSCIKLGTVPVNFNSGNFNNLFQNIKAIYCNDHVDSTGVYLGWADNNRFLSCQIRPDQVNGPGWAITHVRQSGASYDFMPSENVFYHCQIGNGESLLTNGNSGRGIGTIFWPYQAFDSSGLPDYKGLRGFLENGTFFDSAQKMGFHKSLQIFNQFEVARLNILGFSGNAGNGTISTSGVNVTGVGTAFTTQLTVRKAISVGNEFRTIVAILNDNSLTVDRSFEDDYTNTGYFYQIGANFRIFSDGSARLGTWDDSDTRIQAGGADVACFTPNGNITAVGKISGTNIDTEYGNAAGNTISANALINGIIRRTAGGAQTDTTATAAQIVAALTNCQVGQIFNLTILNGSGGVHTLGLGVGVTSPSGIVNVLTTTAFFAHNFMFRVSNITVPAVQIYSLGQSAY